LFLFSYVTAERAKAAEKIEGFSGNLTSEMTIPGGLPVLVKVTGMDPEFLKSPSATEFIFRHLLDFGPPVSGLVQINPARSRLLAFLSTYADFAHYLRKENLLSAGRDGIKAGEAEEVLLSREGADAEKTRKLLTYFGINPLSERSDSPRPKSEKSADIPERQDFLAIMGIDLGDENSPLHISLQTGRLPLVPDVQTWNKILPAGGRSDSIFERFLKNPAAMQLYVGLAGCAPPIRDAVLKSMDSEKLFRYADRLFLYGPSLKAEEGRITFPGSNRSWESLLGIQNGEIPGSISALLKDNAIPLLFYSALASAPPPVQAQIAASPERLQSFLDVLKPYEHGKTLWTPAIAMAQDLPRILRQLVAASEGLRFAMEDRVARAFTDRLAPDRIEESPAGHVLFTPGVLARMLPHAKISPYSSVSYASVLEFLKFLQDTNPGMLTDKSLSVLLDVPEQGPVFLELIRDIVPDPPVLSRYLDYCKTVSSNGLQGWNLNRTRTSQAIFFLISALAHENVFTGRKAGLLLDEALEAFQSENEGSFADFRIVWKSTEPSDRV
jgi:hypothetical protein